MPGIGRNGARRSSSSSRSRRSLPRLPRLAARAAGAPHPYVVGNESVSRYLTVASECALATLAGLGLMYLLVDVVHG